MSKRKSIVFQLIICIFIASMVFLSAILNAYSFINSSIDSIAENKSVMLSQIKGNIEYGLKYGKTLNNYYGMEEILEKAKSSLESEYIYIRNEKGSMLYGEDPDEAFYNRDSASGENDDSEEDNGIVADSIAWNNNGMVHILMSIEGASGMVGYIGIGCKTDSMKIFSQPYVNRIYYYASLEALAGIVLFLILFHVIKHEYHEKNLKVLIMLTIILVSIASIFMSYRILKISYNALSEDAANSILAQSAEDMERLLAAGVCYDDIKDANSYYSGIADAVEQVDSIILTDSDSAAGVSKSLSADSTGKSMHLEAELSTSYISGKLRTAVINTIVTTITAVMISLEILMFLMGLFVGKFKNRRKLVDNKEALTIEEFGIVRGLSFFFASFRFMSVAFMSIVLVQIYTPVYVWGKVVPYEILLSLPMAGMVFVAMITSYMSGIVIHKVGWKKTALMGVAIMMVGALASSWADKPVPFILAQMIMGTGLGFAKMGIDIFAVAVSSEEDMSKYTAGSNAGIIVGYSCSAALGALVASIFGYQGAYIVMTILGGCVFLLILFFGMNVKSREDEEDEELEEIEEQQSKYDIRFPAYLFFVIIPYFFIMMFVDYYFPVYANSEGISTDTIGYVMLIYGIVTAYVGTPLCPVLSKKFNPKILMPTILLILAAALFLFSIKNYVIVAAVIVALIGLVDGIMPSIQFKYVYDLPLARKIGFSKALGIEGFFSNMIGAVAPIIFGVVMMYGNGGLAVVAILVGVCAILFMFINGDFKGGKGKKKITGAMILVILMVSLLGNKSYAADSGDRGKLRIGYSQDGNYYEFDYEIYQIGMALIENGELTSPELLKLKQGDSAQDVWEALCSGTSDKYEFVEGGFIDLNSVPEAEAGKIIEEQNIDLMITMGTSAGLGIKNNSDVPYMNFIASDPVSSEITDGPDFSGDSRSWAHVDSGLEERALLVMDDIFAPEKIGIVYSDADPEAYIYSGAASLDAFADANEREVLREFVVDEFEDTDEAYQKYKSEMLEAHKKLADSGIDVFILTTSYLELSDFGEVLEPFIEKGIPVFSINSTEDVRCGALAAVEMIDYQNLGRFAADTLSKYRNGENLSSLSQQYATAPFLVINIDTMRRTGVKLPLDTLISATEIYGRYEVENE
ncbi:MFS transporter [Butyrivibrio sp. AC2005]|uniref:MFS transporter n=1 Tax=Butyrivibrio sp. AC2005 TaxID=1280672 RepID=UPI00040EE090|nr:MFS transporter [Butyrivibrio sp. AC2005]